MLRKLLAGLQQQVAIRPVAGEQLSPIAARAVYNDYRDLVRGFSVSRLIDDLTKQTPTSPITPTSSRIALPAYRDLSSGFKVQRLLLEEF